MFVDEEVKQLEQEATRKKQELEKQYSGRMELNKETLLCVAGTSCMISICGVTVVLFQFEPHGLLAVLYSILCCVIGLLPTVGYLYFGKKLVQRNIRRKHIKESLVQEDADRQIQRKKEEQATLVGEIQRRMYGSERPESTKRVNNFVDKMVEQIAQEVRQKFTILQTNQSGDYTTPVVEETVHFHVHSAAVTLSGYRVIRFLDFGLQNTNTEIETYARANLITRLLVEALRQYPSAKLDPERENIINREILLAHAEGRHGIDSDKSFSDEYDTAGAAYVDVVIQCNFPNGKYIPPV